MKNAAAKPAEGWMINVELRFPRDHVTTYGPFETMSEASDMARVINESAELIATVYPSANFLKSILC